MKDSTVWRRRGTGLLLVVASVLLALGTTLPILRVDRLVFFSRDASLFGIAWDLVTEGEVLLGIVVFVFSIAFPAVKIGLLAQLAAEVGPHHWVRRNLGFVEALGRWSMMDVLVVALLVFSVKSGGLATATTQPALYCFAGSVLATMLAVHRLTRRHKPAPEESR